MRLSYFANIENDITKKTIKVNFTDSCPCWHEFPLFKFLKKYYNLKYSDNPDFLFSSCYGNNHEKYNNCVKIYYTNEHIIPDMNKFDYFIGYDCNKGDEDKFFRNYYGAVVLNKSIQNRIVTPDMTKRKFCNFIYSNAGKPGNWKSEGAILRQEFCKKLANYKHVDCPGRVLNNMTAPELSARHEGGRSSSKREFIKNYKFTIAFENEMGNYYTTEKLWEPLLSYSVPIYWGNPLVTKDYNPKAFINANDYDNDLDKIVQRVIELDNDDEQYLDMLRQPPLQAEYDYDRNQKLEKWLLDIIEKGNPKKKRINPIKIVKNLLKK